MDILKIYVARLLDEPFGVTLLIGAVLVWWLVGGRSSRSESNVSVPIIGPSGSSFLSSIFGSYQFIFHGREMISTGYHKYKSNGGVFKINHWGRWQVYATGKEIIEELKKMPDEKLSAMEAIVELLECRYTFGDALVDNPFHVPVIERGLTKNLSSLFPHILTELQLAYTQILNLPSTGEWVTIPGSTLRESMLKIIARTTNRAIVGEPLCREPGWIKVNIQYTVDVFLGARIIKLFPKYLKPLAAKFLTTVQRTTRIGMKHLVPVIQERYDLLDSNDNNWDDLPQDYLTYLLHTSALLSLPRNPLDITQRILSVNVAAIHTTSQSMLLILYYLAAYPEYIPLLREEVEDVMGKDEEKWTKKKIGGCLMMDSFMKEVFRFETNAAPSQRVVLQPITLTSPTTSAASLPAASASPPPPPTKIHIPPGTFLSVIALPVHLDPEVYGLTASQFDGLRFSKMRTRTTTNDRDDGGGGDRGGSELLKHQFVNTSNPEYMNFGFGRHACPGRFFAANELKAMLAHLLFNYEFKFAEKKDGKEWRHGEVPQSWFFGGTMIPNFKVGMMFRQRVDGHAGSGREREVYGQGP